MCHQLRFRGWRLPFLSVVAHFAWGLSPDLSPAPPEDPENLPPEDPKGQPVPPATQPKSTTQDGTEDESFWRQRLENLFDLVPGFTKNPVRWRKFVEDRVLGFLKGTEESRRKEILGWFHGLESMDGVYYNPQLENPQLELHSWVVVRQFRERHHALQALKEVLLYLFAGEKNLRTLRSPGWRYLLPFDDKKDKERERFLRACTRFFQKIAFFPAETEGQTQKFFDANKELIRHIYDHADDAPHYLSELMKAVRDAKRKSLAASEASMLTDWRAWVSEDDARTKAHKQRELLRKGRRALTPELAPELNPVDVDEDDEDLWRVWRRTVLKRNGNSRGGFTTEPAFDTGTETHRWQRPLWFWFLCLNPAIEDEDGPGQHESPTGDGQLQRYAAEPEHLLMGAFGPDGGVGAFAHRLRDALELSIVRSTKHLIRSTKDSPDISKRMYNVVRSTEWNTLIRGDSLENGSINQYDVSLDEYLQPFAVLATSEELVEMRSALGNLLSASGLVEGIIDYFRGLQLFSDAWAPEVEIVGGSKNTEIDRNLPAGFRYKEVKTKATKKPWVGGSLLRTLLLDDAKQGKELQQELLKLEGAEENTGSLIALWASAGFLVLLGTALAVLLATKLEQTKKLTRRRAKRGRDDGGVWGGERGFFAYFFGGHWCFCAKKQGRPTSTLTSSREEKQTQENESVSNVDAGSDRGGRPASRSASTTRGSKSFDANRSVPRPSPTSTVPGLLRNNSSSWLRGPSAPRSPGWTHQGPQKPHQVERMSLHGRTPYEHEPQHEQALLGLENYYNPPATALGVEQAAGEESEKLIVYRGVGTSR